MTATVDNDWGTLYRDFPTVYEEFVSAPLTPSWMSAAKDVLPSDAHLAVDVGSGTGQSTLALARRASRVVGVEPELSMLSIATKRASKRRVANVRFVVASSSAIPVRRSCADVVTAIFTTFAPVGAVRAFVQEATRVLRPGGAIVMLDVTPGWYGGELHDVIEIDTGDVAEKDRILRQELGFDAFDVDARQEYGDRERIRRTYGFIFGPRAIRHLQETGQTSIQWRFRLHHRRLDPDIP
jgi:ubiquinone/menaquinone biosynthesis C-methylase UbiE